MIWYLLLPLRGTTEAPVLAPSHPLRSTFTRYGRYVARHVDTVLLLAVAVAAVLLYPFPFLYTTDFTNGASNLPHHVWTDAQPLKEGSVGFEPDVIMRTVWIHGSYMKALEREVLLGALELQDGLLGPTKDFNPRRPPNRAVPTGSPDGDMSPQLRDAFHVVNGRTNQSWFFHSPLQYWSGDAQKIRDDEDIISTVNARKTQSTSVNVTLRHSIVFSGKRFEDRRLVAADALVVTLIHLRDSPVGRQWERKTEQLAASMADRWDAYPPDGRSMPSQLYEFQFRPISFWDLVWLTLAYFLTFIYFLHRVSKLRAVKSKAGLIVTVLVQIVVSIISSFTVCAVFKIDLSKIPQAAYPIVVWSMSLENMFRLINAVITTPSEDSTSSRIGQAFGETAHVALASVLQYLLIILGLSKFVSPGVSAFCTFAAIATLFDFFYLSTFFLSVLSVEVRRTELSDALEKSSLERHSPSTGSRARQSWIEALLQGKVGLSTRIAGIIVMMGFVLIAQWHFFQSENLFRTLGRMFRFNSHAESDVSKPPPLLIDIHQARSPTSWLRLQDHETAREVIHVIKPWAHSYVARVYNPLVFVLKGSDRTPPGKEPALLPAVYDFAHHQTLPLIMAVIVLVSLVRLFMNYLLWDEIAGVRAGEGGDDEPLISIKTVSEVHVLDVALMSATPDGRVVSAGLDRLISVLDVRAWGLSYHVTSPDAPDEDPFPVLAMAIDDDSRWLALLSSSRVRLWDLVNRRWGRGIDVDLHGQKAEAFFFGTRSPDLGHSIVLVRRNGSMAELWPDSGRSKNHTVCKSPLSCAVPLATKSTSRQATSFVTLSRRGCIHKATRVGSQWVSEEVKLPSEERDIQAVRPVPAFTAYLVVRSSSVDLVDFRTSAIIHTFQTEQIQPRTLRFFHSQERKTQSGARGVSSFTLVYLKAEGGECVIQTYLPTEEGGTISFRDDTVGSIGSCSWAEAREVRRRVDKPGLWAALPSGCVVGVRHRVTEKLAPSPSSLEQQQQPQHQQKQQQHSQQGSPRNTVRRRRHTPPIIHSPSSWGDDAFEVWTMTQLEKPGDSYEVVPLSDNSVVDGELGIVGGGGGYPYRYGNGTTRVRSRSDNHLMISEPGPLVKVGVGSVAVAFGNVVKIVTVGQERFRSGFLEDDKLQSRRRRAVGSARNRAASQLN